MKLNSATILRVPQRAAAPTYKAIGFTDEDLRKPIIGIANTWTETMNCNYKLRDLGGTRQTRRPRRPAALRWSSTQSRFQTASRWELKALRPRSSAVK